MQMELEELLATARSGTVPTDWQVWTLRRGPILRAVLLWAFYAVVGFLLLIPALLSTIPSNFQRGGWIITGTLTLYIILGLMAVGSFFFFFRDLAKLRMSSDYMLIMTPDDFVKVEAGKVIRVPMECIDHITLKGVRSAGEAITAHPDITDAGLRTRFLPFFGLRRRPFQLPSLAFVDLRVNRTVVVGADDTFDDLRALEEVLLVKVEAKKRAGFKCAG
jgi:hypothetical protein